MKNKFTLSDRVRPRLIFATPPIQPRLPRIRPRYPIEAHPSLSDCLPGWRVRGIYRYWDDCSEPVTD